MTLPDKNIDPQSSEPNDLDARLEDFQRARANRVYELWLEYVKTDTGVQTLSQRLLSRVSFSAGYTAGRADEQREWECQDLGFDDTRMGEQ